MPTLTERFIASISNRLITDNKLGRIIAVNTKSETVDGAFATYGPIDFLSWTQGKVENRYLYDIIAKIKSTRNTKFLYSGTENTEFNWQILENLLFIWGKACAFKLGGKIFIANFTAKKWDVYRQPTEIRAVLANGKQTKTLIVGKDAAVFFNDDSGLWLRKTWYGPLWKIWGYITDLVVCQRRILENINTARSFLITDQFADQEEIDRIENAIQDKSFVLPLNINQGKDNINANLKNGNNLFITSNDRTENLWGNYVRYWELIKQSLGFNSQLNIEKKERLVEGEVQDNDDLRQSINICELLERKRGLDAFNTLFGTKISVSLSEVIEQKEDEKEEVNKEKDD